MAKNICGIFFLIALFLGHGVVEVKSSHHNKLSQIPSLSSSNQPYRTAFHFQPPKNWMNDPNGPLIYKGIYHLFYQWNPKGAVWGNIVWAHSTSTDLINWTPHDPTIYPSQPSDINGCWSGSTTILPGDKPAILYTGIDPQNKQVQNLALPKNLSDPYLKEWVKSTQNPLMAPNSINQIDSSSFRDPTTAWLGPDGKWRAIIGSKIDRVGLAILYTSTNFIEWVQSSHPLHSAQNTGMWECPDFYPVSINQPNGVDTSLNGPHIKHVLKVSLDDLKHDYYTIGKYNHADDIYTPDIGSVETELGLRYDYGKFYASKTFFDSATKRRILWGWINESSSESDDMKKGWSGLQAIPRKVWLDKSGKQLIQWPITEIKSLRSSKVKLGQKVLKGGTILKVSGVTANQADVEVSFKVSGLERAEVFDERWKNPQEVCSQKGTSVKGGFGPFGLLILASKSMEEYTAVYFRIFKTNNNHNPKYVVLMCSDQTRSSLNEDNDKTSYGAFLDVNPNHQNLSLRTLIDHSIIESFGGEGKTCITSRVYPTLAIHDEAYLYAFNNGTQAVEMSKLNAWSMKKAYIN